MGFIGSIIPAPCKNPPCRDPSGFTPLLTAVERANWDLAEFLIEKGADKKATDNSGIGLFDFACVAGNPSKGIELAGEDSVKHQVSYLFPWVAMAGRLESVKFLIARGAGVNDPAEDGTNALANALGGGAGIPGLAPVSEDDYVKLIEFLVDHGAKPDQRTRGGLLPIDLVAEHCGARVMKALLKAGANPSPSAKGTGRTPLQLAAGRGRAETVQVLLDAGADPRQLDHRGDTLLHLAASEGNDAVVKLLIDRKLPVNVKNKTKEETPLHYAVFSNSTEFVRILLATGADPNARDYHNSTSLITAIDTKALSEIPKAKGNEDLCRRNADLLSRLRIIHLLLEARASTTVIPENYKSLVAYAQDHGCPEIIELLQHLPQVVRKPSKP
jgi:ankyrin repeat protein